MVVIKAGCFVVDKKSKKIALVHRQKQNDYSFPKGHLEKGEDIKACAIRETAEETKRVAIILENFEPYIERYTSSSGEVCECYMFIALDGGASDNVSADTHEVVWVDFCDVKNRLSYPSLKQTWDDVKGKIATVLGIKE